MSCSLLRAPGSTEVSAPEPVRQGGAANTSFYVRNSARGRVIVFVHGLFGDAVSTWTNRNGTYWPTLVARDPIFDDSDIYVHSFPSPILQRSYDTDELAERLRIDLSAHDVLRDHKEIVFVCHSMGGIVVRAFLLKTRLRPTQVPMLFLASTPTTGAEVAQLASALSRNPQADYLLPGDTAIYVRKVQADWLGTSLDPETDYPNRIATFCAYEKLATYGIKIVQQQSATALCNRPLTAIDEDHIDIVKPSGIGADVHRALEDAYRQTFPSVASLPGTRTVIGRSSGDCPFLYVDFYAGTVNGLGVNSTVNEITKTLTCATAVADESDTTAAGAVSYDKNGFAFLTKAHIIDVWQQLTEQRPPIVGASSKRIREMLGQPTLSEVQDGPPSPDKALAHIKSMASYLYATRYGCLAVTLVNDSVANARIDARPCDLEVMGLKTVRFNVSQP